MKKFEEKFVFGFVLVVGDGILGVFFELEVEFF